jgi:hypothetical protein
MVRIKARNEGNMAEFTRAYHIRCCLTLFTVLIIIIIIIIIHYKMMEPCMVLKRRAFLCLKLMRALN